MDNPKQQAVMLLLGALLVGGALGFSADRVFRKAPHSWGYRQTMYEDIGASCDQRVAMDSLWDSAFKQIHAVMQATQPQIDSIKQATRLEVQKLLTPDQYAKLRQRISEDSARWTHSRANKPSRLTRESCK
jgi:hypothetical protein